MVLIPPWLKLCTVTLLQQHCRHILFRSEEPCSQDQRGLLNRFLSKWMKCTPYLQEVKKWLWCLQTKPAKTSFLAKSTLPFTCLVSEEHVHWLQMCIMSQGTLSSLIICIFCYCEVNCNSWGNVRRIHKEPRELNQQTSISSNNVVIFLMTSRVNISRGFGSHC